MTPARVSTFRVADLLLGVDVARVTEVVRDLPYVPVPLSHPSIAGLTNLRGRILTVFDARRRLGIHAPRGDGDATVHLVLTGPGGGAASLLVDRAGEVVDVTAADADELPETIDPWLHSLTVAAHQVEQGLLLVLDSDALLDPHVNPRTES